MGPWKLVIPPLHPPGKVRLVLLVPGSPRSVVVGSSHGPWEGRLGACQGSLVLDSLCGSCAAPGAGAEGFACLPPQAPGKYTVVVDDEKGGPNTLALRSGDMVEVVQEGEDGLW